MLEIVDNDRISLFPCTPNDWLWIPRRWRDILAWTTSTMLTLSFTAVPLSALFLVNPYTWKYLPMTATSYIATLALVSFVPSSEYPPVRKMGQLW